MESSKRDDTLIDFDNPNKYSIRTLKCICEKNSIEIPLWPDKKQLISALEAQQKIIDQNRRDRERRNQSIKDVQSSNETFNTPVLPMSLINSAESSFPTPIISSRRVPSELPDKKSSINKPIPHCSPVINALAAEENYLRMREKEERGPIKKILFAAVILSFIFVLLLLMMI